MVSIKNHEPVSVPGYYQSKILGFANTIEYFFMNNITLYRVPNYYTKPTFRAEDRPNGTRVVTGSQSRSHGPALGRYIRSIRIYDTADWADNDLASH